MTSLATQHRGFVLKLDGDHIIVQLRRGGTKRCKNRGFSVGNDVAIIFNVAGKITDIMPLNKAEQAVECGKSHVFSVSLRTPRPEETEVIADGNDNWDGDGVYGNPWNDPLTN